MSGEMSAEFYKNVSEHKRISCHKSILTDDGCWRCVVKFIDLSLETHLEAKFFRSCFYLKISSSKINSNQLNQHTQNWHENSLKIHTFTRCIGENKSRREKTFIWVSICSILPTNHVKQYPWICA